MKSTIGKWNIGLGIWELATFMIYGFGLIYLRDLSSNRDVWLATTVDGPQALARLAHVHGTLFSTLNIIFGCLLLRLPISTRQGRWISALAPGGPLMPVGHASPVQVSAFHFSETA